MTDLAIVVVTWNTRDLVVEALRSLYDDLAQSGLREQVFVVDNASTDGTPEAIQQQFPQVTLVVSRDNLGFVRANNLAMRQMGFGGRDANVDGASDQDCADGLPRVVYLLNPDTITQPGATLALFNTLLSHDHAGLVGARLTYGDGSFQHSAFHFPGLRQLWVEFFPTPGRFIEGTFNGRYPRRLYESDQPFRVDCVLGATMMLRREVIQQTGLFDENFFMYCEEIDWAWRIRKSGWQVLCVPSAHVVHLEGRSTSQVPAQSVIRLWTSRLLLYRKHYPAWKYTIARRMIAAGMRHKMRQISASLELPDEARGDLLAAYRQIVEMVSR